MELLMLVDPKVVDGPPELQAARYAAGSVVCARPDGYGWSEWERTDPRHRIVRVDITEEEAALLLAPQLGDPLLGPLKIRAYTVDLQHKALSAGFRAAIAKGARPHAIFDARPGTTGAAFLSAKQQQPRAQALDVWASPRG